MYLATLVTTAYVVLLLTSLAVLGFLVTAMMGQRGRNWEITNAVLDKKMVKGLHHKHNTLLLGKGFFYS